MQEGPCIGICVKPPQPIVDYFAKSIVSNHHIRALIDTGASITGINETVLQKLGLIPRDIGVFSTPSGHSELPIYHLQLEIVVKPDGTRGLFDLEAPGIRVENQIYEGIIGRDILQFCNFNYRGRENAFDLKFFHKNL